MMDIPWNRVRKIVLLNLIANTVGDTLAVGPLITVLKRHCPQASITVTASPKNASLLSGLADHLVPLEELADIGKKISRWTKAWQYLKLMHRCVRLLRETKPEVCFVLLPNFWLSHLIPLIARVPYRVGFTYRGSIFAWVLTHHVPFRGSLETQDHHLHFLDSNLSIFESVGVPVHKEDMLMRKIVNEDARMWARKFFLKHHLTGKDTLVAFQAGAKWKNKQWPAEYFVAVAKALVTKHKAKILLFGTLAEKEINEPIVRAVGTNATLIVDESLENVAALLERCTLAFGNDSGIMHLASGVGTTPVVIYSTTNYRQSFTRGPGGGIPIESKEYRHLPMLSGAELEEGIKRMRSISVEQALQVLEHALKQKRQRKNG